MYELRWVVRQGWDDPEKVLQYRVQRMMPCYSMVDENGDFIKVPTWSEWKDVPTENE